MKKEKIIFFNGWGMDEVILEDIKNMNEYELELISFPYVIKNKDIFNQKNEIIFMAWSFGVYYLNKFLEKNKDLNYKKSIAINGIPDTIGKFGINKKMFDLTLETLNQENLEKFYQNMDTTFSKKKIKTLKNFQDIKNELASFKENYKKSEKNYIDFYYIGTYDRIIPSNKQEKYCIKNKIEYKLLECSHYPFYFIKDLKDLM